MKTQSHQLDILHTTGSKYKYKCKLCQQEWITFPTSTCPGVNVFTSRDPTVCPERYKTLAELEAKDLRPEGVDQPIAAFRPSHRGAWDFLYDETEALPKRRSEATVRILKGGFRLFAWLVNVVVASLCAPWTQSCSFISYKCPRHELRLATPASLSHHCVWCSVTDTSRIAPLFTSLLDSKISSNQEALA